MQPLLRLLRHSGLFKVTEFGTDRKLTYFLLVTSSNLYHRLRRFRDIAFKRSKIAIFWLLILRLTPDGGVPWDDLCKFFIERSEMAKVPNGVETLPKIA